VNTVVMSTLLVVVSINTVVLKKGIFYFIKSLFVYYLIKCLFISTNKFWFICLIFRVLEINTGWYGDSVINTVKVKSGMFFLVQICYLTSARV